MPLNLNVSVKDTAIKGGLPAGYTPPTLPDLPTDQDDKNTFNVNVVGTADGADPIVSLNAIISAIDTEIVNNYATAEMGLNTSGETIDMNAIILKIERKNNQSDPLILGAEVYECEVFLDYLVQ